MGLHWLEPGPNTIGSAPENTIVLPENAPAALGTLTLADGNVTFEPADGDGAWRAIVGAMAAGASARELAPSLDVVYLKLTGEAPGRPDPAGGAEPKGKG